MGHIIWVRRVVCGNHASIVGHLGAKFGYGCGHGYASGNGATLDNAYDTDPATVARWDMKPWLTGNTPDQI